MIFNKKEFARFLLEEKVLQFGEFKLKSGRVSPHFFNSGRFDNGQALNRLGQFMAQRLIELGGVDIIFGPAYKGIPLAVAVAMAYNSLSGSNVGFLFDRKEKKDHADGGLFVGRLPQVGDRVAMVDDVISSGISLKEGADLLVNHFDVTPVMALVCVDRQEKGSETNLSAAQELKELKNVSCEALLTLEEVIELMEGEMIHGDVILTKERQQSVREYLKAYGSL